MAQLTVRDIIQRAFESAGVVVIGQTVGARESSYALGITNEILDKWTSDGITHGLSDVTHNTELFDGALSSCLRKNLTVDVAEPFGGQVSDKIQREAISELANLMPLDVEVEYDTALSSTPSTFHIDSGYR